jgi:hypothetical protein
MASKEVREKIHTYLSSDMMDIVRLGVQLMAELIPREEWDAFLVRGSMIEGHGPYYKWHFSIRNNKVEVYEEMGIWGKLQQGGYKHTYIADHFSISTLSSAIEDFYNNKQ